MTSPHHDFNEVAKVKAPKYPPPFSLRLTFVERARLERDAAGMSLGAYIRSRLFGDDVPPRRTRGKFPVKDQAALAKVLAALGASRLSQNLNQLARAVNIGALPVTPETDSELRDACRAVAELRDELLRALGKTPGGAP
ncbi:hypothetical protein PE067_08800 [Paracoccus sp. DMF-8]|uniref:hypothetical protein n=1 Tax=Paracoccus sp. DMF-8 TaxID=3019445 RepID=UPI0023E8779F|nr:hypothetical protein [Paracoccus sp. DMF-8]MDF3606222.1 hypothetical protein [Paracoccus sp. DMF-8]